MKKISLFLALFFLIFTSGQIKWMTLEEAVEAQRTVPKKILIEFYTDICVTCKKMETETFNHPQIAENLQKNYYLVKFDAESKKNITLFGRKFSNLGTSKSKNGGSLHEFTKFMSVNAVPTTVFLDEQSMPITLLQGAITAKELEPYVTFISTDDYKKISSRDQWESYQKKFKSKIKD
ncbi:Thioredoxin-like [Kaistella treverensis]|uniref:Thioredoxin-like n=1 Tax=Kaistella treverensis TaxID=631455 RepID=A0A1I3JUH0_9FLAO|nr:thioredoxin family protein [Kaistella treverensis]SFI63658.1 Thioredoxin-like [Kaistella treverensis]